MAGAADKDKKQLMDVAKPGSTSAAPSGRPVIVGHGPVMKDPMMKEATEESSVAVEEKPAPSVSHKKIEPLTSAEEPGPEASTEATEEISTESEAAVVDAVIGQAADKKKAADDADAITEQEAAISKLVEDKTYFVPIGKVAKRRKKVMLVLILIVLLGLAAGGAYAYTAGLLDTILPLQV